MRRRHRMGTVLETAVVAGCEEVVGCSVLWR